MTCGIRSSNTYENLPAEEKSATVGNVFSGKVLSIGEGYRPT